MAAESTACDRVDFVVECFKSAREELMFRVKHRDNWLKLQLLAQAVLASLASRIKLGGVEATDAMPKVLSLAIPVSLILACLYYVEDGLVHKLSGYIAGLSAKEAGLRKQTSTIASWDCSDELRNYARYLLPLRIVAQIAAFVLIPGFLVFSRLIKISISQYEGAIQGAVFAVVAVIVLASYQLRRKTGRNAVEDSSPQSANGEASPKKRSARKGARQSIRERIW